jgi:hypothetical protein
MALLMLRFIDAREKKVRCGGQSSRDPMLLQLQYGAQTTPYKVKPSHNETELHPGNAPCFMDILHNTFYRLL